MKNIHNIDGGATNNTATATGTPSVDQLNNHLTPAAYSSEIIEILEEDEEVLISSATEHHYKNKMSIFGKSGGQKLVPISEGGIETNTTSLFSIDIHNNDNNNSGRWSDEVVYVAVGKSASSIDALQWTLNNSVHPGKTIVYLIHIFSDLKFIPSPLGGGMVPKTQVSPDLVKHYLVQETSRRELLTKYVDKCTSHMVQVETILIESDSVGNAIVELISVLNIRQLVVGISMSNLRKVKTGKGSATIAEYIRQRAPEGCKLNIVCQGKQLSMSESEIIYNRDNLQSPPASSSNAASSTNVTQFQEDELQPTSNGPFLAASKLNVYISFFYKKII